MAPRYSTARIIAALRQTNGLVHLAAKQLNCNPQTIYNRAKASKDVRQAIEESRDELVDLAEAKLRGLVLVSDPWAVGFVLRTLGKKRGYVERQELDIEHSGEFDVHVSIDR